jgi:hypothetical protein
MFTFFYLYNYFNRSYYQWLKKKGGTVVVGAVTNLVLGYVAAFLNICVLTPFEVCTTRSQCGAKTKANNIFTAVVEQYRAEGIGSLYTGIMANLVLSSNPAIEFTVVDQAKKFILAKTLAKSLTSGQAFCTGGLAKSVATLITFPYVRAKVILQGTKDATEAKMSPFSVIVRCIRDDGLKGLYMGIGVALMKGVLKSAVLLMVKEKIDKLILGGGLTTLYRMTLGLLISMLTGSKRIAPSRP